MANEATDGGPAFPGPHTYGWRSDVNDNTAPLIEHMSGMSLRDWFAGQAMAALIAERAINDGLVVEAYEIADAMLAARKPGVA